jgi:hypothetical protein
MAEPRHIESLHDSLGKLTEETKGLATFYSHAEEQRKKKTTVMLALLCASAVLLVVLLVEFFRVSSVARQIDSCTNPRGACYQDGRARTGSAVDLIVQGQIYVAECSRSTTTDAALEKCVMDKFAVAKEKSGR